MTPQALQTLIANGEDTRLQFKRDFAHVDSLAAELVAFVNGFGGTLQRPLTGPGNAEKAGSEAESKAESLSIRVLTALQNGGALSKAHIAEAQGLRHVPGQLNAQVRALLNHGHIEMTLPEKPNSRLQQYRLTQEGMLVLATAPSAPAQAPDQRNLPHV